MKYEFKTKDSDEASFLLTNDDHFTLTGAEPVEKYGKTTVWFTFETDLEEAELSALRLNYRHGKCLVEPRKHSDRRAEIRSVVKDCLNGQGPKRF